MKVYEALARTAEAWTNCIKSGNEEWQRNHELTFQNLCRNHLPSGSGWDMGTRGEIGKSHSQRLWLFGEFHHMNENGMYDGWTEHSIIVTPSLSHDIDIKITGKDRNGIKEYLAELFHFALVEEITEEQYRDAHQ